MRPSKYARRITGMTPILMGGPAADIDPETSVTGMKKVIMKFTPETRTRTPANTVSRPR